MSPLGIKRYRIKISRSVSFCISNPSLPEPAWQKPAKNISGRLKHRYGIADIRLSKIEENLQNPDFPAKGMFLQHQDGFKKSLPRCWILNRAAPAILKNWLIARVEEPDGDCLVSFRKRALERKSPNRDTPAAHGTAPEDMLRAAVC